MVNSSSGEAIGKRKKKAPKNTADSVDGANSDKKMKKIARNKKRKGTELPEAETVESFVFVRPADVNERESSTDDRKRNKLKKKKSDKEKSKGGVREYVSQSNEDEDYSNQRSDNPDDANSDKKMKKISRKKKRKTTELSEAETPEIVVSPTRNDVGEGKNSAETSDKKRNKLKKKRKVKENSKKVGTHEHILHANEAGDDSNQQSGKPKSVSQLINEASLLDDDDEVYQISSGDEDETTGMKRWITKYHRARPGAEVLMENINDFLVDYWAQKEKERKEREEEAAEGGWTVVTHLKGRKKTTDAESGTTVGSVAQAAVMDKMSKKKDKQVGINFYSFQRREAQRNEIMMLQSKFEQDKKRIQQLRAARKFRPY
ncbi:uncharacterized protein LOC143576156 [Bidens hawaiensis]|uniref:uncharacterized protein LOC143576156 n=1 Tax=Bidens hawaiensis TaxID=980011 RepID=UPI004049DC4C